ncbi:MAG: hypothetical protein ACSLFB_01980 [Acidimicrobiales bacterium]
MPKDQENTSPVDPTTKTTKTTKTPPAEPPPFEPLLDLIIDVERDQSPEGERRLGPVTKLLARPKAESGYTTKVKHVSAAQVVLSLVLSA